jgi:hypothetical protein
MRKDEFSAVQDRHWTPVELVGEAIPEFLSGVPRHKAFRFLASGESNVEAEGALVGGIDVYRHSPDDPVALNKDWYEVRSAGDGTLRVYGPQQDNEHWVNEVPRRYKDIEIIGVRPTEPAKFPEIEFAGQPKKSE